MSPPSAITLKLSSRRKSFAIARKISADSRAEIPVMPTIASDVTTASLHSKLRRIDVATLLATWLTFSRVRRAAKWTSTR